MLQSSDVLPSLTFARVCGGEIHSPGDPGEFGMVVFHRGFGYGFGNALACASDGQIRGEDVKIVSVPVDDRENSEALVEKRKRGFPVAYRADARAVFAATRAFVNDASVYLEATGFGDRRKRPPDARRCAGSVPQVVSSAKNRGTAADWRGGR